MALNRREFIKCSSAALAVGSVGTAAGQSVEDVIREVKFIDAHAHVLEYSVAPKGGRQPICSPDEQLAFWDRLGVEKGVILGVAYPESLVGGMSVESILRVCATHPDRFVPSCCCDPRAIGNRVTTRFDQIFAYYREKGCKAIGEVCANLHFLDPRVQNFFKGAEVNGLPVTFHVAADEEWLYGLVDSRGLPELEECLKRFPKLNFLGHSQSFWCEIGTYRSWDERTGYPKGPVVEGRLPQLLRRYPNLYGDLSAGSGLNALKRDPDYAAKFLTEFQDRLLFGLDICSPTGFVSSLGDLLRNLYREGSISEVVFRKVARENAIRVFGLS